LKELYSEESMLSFEGEQFRGCAAIIEKFSSFGNIKHDIKRVDAQPTVRQGILCFISGDSYIMEVKMQSSSLKYLKLFPGGSAGYFCFNDMFRLKLWLRIRFEKCKMIDTQDEAEKNSYPVPDCY